MKPKLHALLALASVFSVRAADAKCPNSILIMADAMGFSCISTYGGEIHTTSLQLFSDHRAQRTAQMSVAS